MFKIKFAPKSRREKLKRFNKEWTIGDRFETTEECVVGTRVIYAGIPVPATIVDNPTGPLDTIKIKFDYQPPSPLSNGVKLALAPDLTYFTWHPTLLRKIKPKID